MIDSLFIIDAASFSSGGTQGKVIIEKHYRSPAAASKQTPIFLDEFWDHVGKNFEANKNNSLAPTLHVLPLQAAGDHYLVHILRGNVFFLAVVTSENDPMNVVSFLHQMVDLFVDYFGTVTEVTIKDNFATIYELLEEMLDNGKPYITEANILKELIPPPTLFFGVRSPTGALSHIPWRTPGLKYTNNEIFFDINEDIDVVLDRYGKIVNGSISGEIVCTSKLSGMPDLTLMFANSRIFDMQQTSFHHCVRYPRFERDRVLSFIPPDGTFKLMTYTLPMQHVQALPLMIKPAFHLTSTTGKLSITIQPRSTGGRPLDFVTITTRLPPPVSTIKLDASIGSVGYDQATRVVTWTIPRLGSENNTNVSASLSGIAYLESPNGDDGEDKKKGKGAAAVKRSTLPPLLNVGVQAKVGMFAVSGLKIDVLQVLNEAYKPFKGVKMYTRARNFYART
ncbi:AP-3 complex subunit mu-2 [Phlyctochytrium bullatum]|nr:AP-3 complex subunit mu-2 [Phlyctochytrium bullatum]